MSDLPPTLGLLSNLRLLDVRCNPLGEEALRAAAAQCRQLDARLTRTRTRTRTLTLNLAPTLTLPLPLAPTLPLALTLTRGGLRAGRRAAAHEQEGGERGESRGAPA